MHLLSTSALPKLIRQARRRALTDKLAAQISCERPPPMQEPCSGSRRLRRSSCAGVCWRMRWASARPWSAWRSSCRTWLSATGKLARAGRS